METGAFTWFKDMGGNSNWMYIKVVNVSNQHVSLALWLLYEASTEPLVDPLTGSGSIQVGFFNQSKNLNRQVPLFELAEESKPGLEIGAGQSSTLKVRINDLSSHHQNQRFIIVIGPADAPIRGSRSVPIEIMSKPRVDSDASSSNQQQQQQANAPPPTLPASLGVPGPPTVVPVEMHPGLKRSLGDAPPAVTSAPAQKRQFTEADARAMGSGTMLTTLVAMTDPAPTRQRKLDLIVTLLSGLPRDELEDLHRCISTKLLGLPTAQSNGGPGGPGPSGGGVVLLETSSSTGVVGSAGGASSSAGDRPSSRQSNPRAIAPPPLKPTTPSAAAAAEAERKAHSRPTNGPGAARVSADSVYKSEGDPLDAAMAAAAAADDTDAQQKPRNFQPLVKAVLAFQQSARHAAERSAEKPQPPPWVASVLERFPAGESLDITEEQLENFFVTENSSLLPSVHAGRV